MDQVKFAEDSFLKTWNDMVYLSRPYHFIFFEGCLPQISLHPFLNTFSQIRLCNKPVKLRRKPYKTYCIDLFYYKQMHTA